MSLRGCALRKRTFIAASLLIMPISAARADRYEDCNAWDSDPERSERGCSEIIERGRKESVAWRAGAHNGRGNVYYSKGDYDRAIADYTKAVELDPKDAVTHNNRGVAYYVKRDYDHAIADYTKAVELDPKFAVAYSNRGGAYYDKGDYDHAIADHNKAIALNPKYGAAYLRRGTAYYKKGDYDRAIADLTRHFELGGNTPAAFRTRAEAYEKTGKKALADADYDKATALELAATGAASGWLGLEIANLSDKEAKALGWAAPRGARAVKVLPNTPAAAAGLMEGDIIIMADDRAIANNEGLSNYIASLTADTKVLLRLMRGQNEISLTATLSARPKP